MITIERVQRKRESLQRWYQGACRHDGPGALQHVGMVAAATCDCKLQWAYELEAFEAGIPVEFWNWNPAKDLSTNVEVFDETIRPWVEVENLAKIFKKDGELRGFGLFLTGPNGVGKSTFLSWICMELIRRTSFPVYYTTTLRLIKDYKSTFGNTEAHDARRVRLEAMLGRAVLVIDELGKETYRDGDSFYRVELETILRDRIDGTGIAEGKKLPTLIASNRGLDEIAAVPEKGGYGPTFASLIRGNMRIIGMEPGDMRPGLGAAKSEML